MSYKYICPNCKGDKYEIETKTTCKDCGSTQQRLLLCVCSSCGKEQTSKTNEMTTIPVEIRISNRNAPDTHYYLGLCDECLAEFKDDIDTFKNCKGVII